jgi:chaperonin GroEL
MASPLSFYKLTNHGKESRDRIYAGVKVLTDLVSSTLGPGGRFVCIKRSGHPLEVPFLTKDGKTVAESVFLKDEFEDAGAQMVKDVSVQTCKESGDGTTTAAVIAESIFKQGLDAIEAGANPVMLKKGMDSATESACDFLRKLATKVEDEDIRKVATISANGDEYMADLVATAVIKAGKTGAVELDYSNTTETKIQVVDGCQLNSGWISPTFVTDPKTGEALLSNPYILLFDKKLQSISEMLQPQKGEKPLLEQISDQQRPLLIIAEDIQGEALATLTFNKVRGVLQSCAIRTPGYKEAGREILEDIAALTGATVISDDLGLKLSSIGFQHLGQAGTVKVGQSSTSILDGKSDSGRLNDRIEEIQAAQARETDQMQIERLQLRLSRLSGGVVVIRIGGYTTLEVEEKKYRAEDAMHAIRAALEMGIVPGGGIALVRATGSFIPLQQSAEDYANRTDFEKGQSIVGRAMLEPVMKIASNAGFNPEEVLLKVHFKEGSYGFNALTGEYGDLKEMGIIDPLKVVLSAFRNAESIASNMLLVEGMILPVNG